MKVNYTDRVYVKKYVVLICIVAVSSLIYIFSLKITRVSSDFSKNTITSDFISYATRIHPMLRLQVAQIEQVEIFERKSEARIFWDRLKLPNIVIEARVPVEYNYFIEINESWTLSHKNGEVRLVAPNISIGTPAPNISQLRFFEKEGSLFRSSKELQSDLKGELTNLLEYKAYENIPLIKEIARKEVETLVKLWLKAQSIEVDRINIYFKDEVEQKLH